MKLRFREIDPSTGEETITEQEYLLLNSAQYAEHMKKKRAASAQPATARKPAPPPAQPASGS